MMNMLTINEEQVKVFEQLQFQKLKQQIAKVLSDEVVEWKQFAAKKQRQWVDFLFNEAQKAKMITDTEYILFAWVCMSSKKDCQLFLGEEDVEEILQNDEQENEEKLIKLSELTTITIKKKEGSWEIKRREESV
ncbi:MAG: hypothetical protein L3J51_05030 [Cocleimonas sp.]|nr:hypothetical protein [Cocleimonas sp.]